MHCTEGNILFCVDSKGKKLAMRQMPCERFEEERLYKLHLNEQRTTEFIFSPFIGIRRHATWESNTQKATDFHTVQGESFRQYSKRKLSFQGIT